MPYKQISTGLVIILVLAFGSALLPLHTTAEDIDSYDSKADEWIVRWVSTPLAPSEDYQIMEQDMDLKVSLIQIRQGLDTGDVLSRLSNDSNILYIERNVPVRVEAFSRQVSSTNQYFLDQTRIRDIQGLVEPNPDLTIAILDTGVDLTHPDLVDNLITGYNLIDSRKPPQDDNGHGTMVAGIIGATGKTMPEVIGILKRVRIMPIKVMREDGSGDSLNVSKGIHLAVDEGADIVLLSLGDPLYSPTMQEAVRYAEDKHVLVISATGNEGTEVNYPAVFPTVLGVGASDPQDRVESYSNFGPGTDVVAPGYRIFTTELGGDYTISSGTSMAAPQVAGLAALLMSKYPDYPPAKIRNLLRFTAKDIEAPGWDPKSGFGRIDAMKALLVPLPLDIYEPNDFSIQAKMVSVGKMEDALLSTNKDIDWYKIEAPNKGKIRMEITGIPQSNIAMLKAGIYTSDGTHIKSIISNRNVAFESDVEKGTYLIKIDGSGTMDKAGLPYSITASFRVYDDLYGNNNTSDQAAKISLETKSIKGTLNKDYDEDWFEFNIPMDGEFNFKLTPDSLRVDPVVTVIKPDKKKLAIDEGGVSGVRDLKYNMEQGNIQVTEGSLKIGVKNFYHFATNAEYTLEWEFKPDVIDKYEPNNNLFDAKLVKLGDPIYGFIASIADYDYFKFTIANEGLYQLNGVNFPLQVRPSLSLYDQDYNRLTNLNVASNATSFSIQRWFDKGTYFIKIDARSKFTNQLYKLMIQRLGTAFKDTMGNWAQSSINHLTGLGVIKGYEDKNFRPNQAITRGEFVHLIVNALQIPPGQVDLDFKDVDYTYWAYNSIKAAYQRGIVTGYEDESFRPNEPISRAEMVTFLVRGLSYKPVNNSDRLKPINSMAQQRFIDIPKRSWYTDDLSILLQMGLINGFEDGSFRPIAQTSRAEAVTMLERIWYQD